MASWSVTHLTQAARRAFQLPGLTAKPAGPTEDLRLPRLSDASLNDLLSLQGPSPELRAEQQAPRYVIEERFAVSIPEARRQLVGARFAVDGAARAISASLEAGAGLSPRVSRALERADQLLAAAAQSRDVQILQSTGHVRDDHLALREAYAGLLRQIAALQLDLLRAAQRSPSSAPTWDSARELALEALGLVKAGAALEPEPLHWAPDARRQRSVAQVTDVFPYEVTGAGYVELCRRSIAQAFHSYIEAERREAAGDAKGALSAYREAVDYTLGIHDWSSASLNHAVAQMYLADAIGRLSSGNDAKAEAEKLYQSAIALYYSSAGSSTDHEVDRKSALQHAARVLNDRGAFEAVDRLVASTVP